MEGGGWRFAWMPLCIELVDGVLIDLSHSTVVVADWRFA
jgi:hypothetical protein